MVSDKMDQNTSTQNIPISTELMQLLERMNVAHHHDPRAIANTVCELVTNDDMQIKHQEKEVALNVLGELIGFAQDDILSRLANKLAHETDVPHDLIIALAHKEIEISEPILLYQISLTEKDLIDLVAKHGAKHWQTISKRAELSTQLMGRLIEQDDPFTWKNLLENKQIKIDQNHLWDLCHKAREHGIIQDPLLQRDEISTQIASRIYWWVNATLRAKIINRFDIPRSKLDQILQDTIHEIDEDNKALCDAFVMAQIRARKLVAETLITCLREHRVDFFVNIMAHFAHLPPQTMKTLVTHVNSKCFSVTCRALGINKNHFASIFLLSRGLRDGDHTVDSKELSETLTFYDRLRIPDAQQIMISWQHDPMLIPCS